MYKQKRYEICWQRSSILLERSSILKNIKTKVKEVKTWIPGVSVTERELNQMLQEKSSIEKYYNRNKGNQNLKFKWYIERIYSLQQKHTLMVKM